MEADAPTLSAHLNWCNPHWEPAPPCSFAVNLTKQQPAQLHLLLQGISGPPESSAGSSPHSGQSWCCYPKLQHPQSAEFPNCSTPNCRIPKLQHPQTAAPPNCSIPTVRMTQPHPATLCIFCCCTKNFGFAFPKDLRRKFFTFEGKALNIPGRA